MIPDYGVVRYRVPVGSTDQPNRSNQTTYTAEPTNSPENIFTPINFNPGSIYRLVIPYSNRESIKVTEMTKDSLRSLMGLELMIDNSHSGHVTIGEPKMVSEIYNTRAVGWANPVMYTGIGISEAYLRQRKKLKQGLDAHEQIRLNTSNIGHWPRLLIEWIKKLGREHYLTAHHPDYVIVEANHPESISRLIITPPLPADPK